MAERRMGIIGLLFCLFFYLMPCSTQAVVVPTTTGPIFTQMESSITLSCVRDGTAFANVPVKLYKIADVSNRLQYTHTASFLSSGLVLNDISSVREWDIIRSTLESYILANSIEPDLTGVTDPAGQVLFSPLMPGLYLAIAEDSAQNDLHCFFEPALIALPGLGDDGRWRYQITVTPKSGVIPPITPDEKEDPDDKDEISFKLLKLWKGETNQDERPQSIEAEIFRNGELNQTVTLSEENHWSYHWTAEEGSADWMVVERNIPAGYTVTVEERSTTFILTNTRLPDEPPPDEPPPDDPLPDEPPPEELLPDDPPPTDAPKTGDTPHILLYTVLMYVSGMILVLLGITGKRKCE